MASADAGQRQLAQLQLLAAAAIDLHLASDLVRRADEGSELKVAERRASVPGAIVQLQEVLNAPPQAGIAGLISGQVERGGPSTPEAARTALQQTVKLIPGRYQRRRSAGWAGYLCQFDAAASPGS